MTHCQYDAGVRSYDYLPRRRASPALDRCLAIEEHLCEQLAQGCYHERASNASHRQATLIIILASRVSGSLTTRLCDPSPLLPVPSHIHCTAALMSDVSDLSLYCPSVFLVVYLYSFCLCDASL